MDWQALALSLKLASLTTVGLFVLALPLAFFISQRPGRVASLIESLISLPIVLPPTVIGFYLLLALSRAQLAFSFSGLLIASMLYSLPFAFQPFLSAFQSIDPVYFETSWLLGESKWRTFWRVAVPLARPGIFSGAILAFAHTLGEFGVVLMVGGNIPGATRTLSMSIYDSIEGLDYAAAHKTAAFLLTFSLVALLATTMLRKKALVRL